ncbi:MAG: DUF2182 domain-containing protein [Armatimonadetes bacterium]|nr:DUF2182 domain-containing protein [Armatimonadota bacterium]
MERPSAVEAVLRRDRAVVLAGLILLAVVCWAYLVHDAWRMYHPEAGVPLCCRMAESLARPGMHAWGAAELLALFVMWVVMMVAMMVPCAAPMVLTYALIHRRRRGQQPFAAAGLFLLGYLLVWIAYSAAATVAQAGLHAATLLSPLMVSTSPVLGGLLLVVTGLSQFSRLKHACLRHCRSPLDFILNDWREGPLGAVRMGVRHGVYCTVCCWLVMGLLFVLGVMNLAWIAALTAFVLAEKVLPRGHAIGKVGGVVFIVWGLALLAGK